MSKRPSTPFRPRTALHLDGTHTRVASFLDFPAAFALQYAQAWSLHEGRMKVPASVIVRRALMHYVSHLEKQRGTEALHEWRRIAQAAKCGKASISNATEAEAQQAASDRLRACAELPAGTPLPPFLEALHGAVECAARDAWFADLESATEASVQSIANSRRGRMFRLPPSTQSTNE